MFEKDMWFEGVNGSWSEWKCNWNVTKWNLAISYKLSMTMLIFLVVYIIDANVQFMVIGEFAQTHRNRHIDHTLDHMIPTFHKHSHPSISYIELATTIFNLLYTLHYSLFKCTASPNNIITHQRDKDIFAFCFQQPYTHTSNLFF